MESMIHSALFRKLRHRILHLVLVLTAVCSAVAGMVLLVREGRGRILEIWPASNWVVEAYSDADQGGRSRCVVDTLPGQRLRMDWRLDSAPVPYVGMLLEYQGPPLDVRAFDSLALDWDTDRGTALRVVLLAHEAGFTRADRPVSRRYLLMECVPGTTVGPQSLPLDRFATPAWWFRVNQRPVDNLHRPLDRVLALAIEMGESVGVGAHDIVRVRGIRLVRTPRLSLGGVGLVFLSLVLAGLAGLGRLPLYRSGIPSGLEPVPLAVPPPRQLAVQEWMCNHYHDPDLSLEKLAAAIGVGKDTASTEVRKAMGEAFKPALNRLRLQEARRLLLETELGISEIAYRVGYANVTHFNRVSKEAWGDTPSGVRAGRGARHETAPSPPRDFPQV
jgi:AraC-like DNA-binding protein